MTENDIGWKGNNLTLTPDRQEGRGYLLKFGVFLMKRVITGSVIPDDMPWRPWRLGESYYLFSRHTFCLGAEFKPQGMM